MDANWDQNQVMTKIGSRYFFGEGTLPVYVECPAFCTDTYIHGLGSCWVAGSTEAYFSEGYIYLGKYRVGVICKLMLTVVCTSG